MGMDLTAIKGAESVWFGRWRYDLGTPDKDNVDYLIGENERELSEDKEFFLKSVIDIQMKKDQEETFNGAFDFLIESLSERYTKLQILRTCKELLENGWEVRVE